MHSVSGVNRSVTSRLHLNGAAMLFAVSVLAGCGLYLARLARDVAYSMEPPRLETAARVRELALAGELYRSLVDDAVRRADVAAVRAGGPMLERMGEILRGVPGSEEAGTRTVIAAALARLSEAAGALSRHMEGRGDAAEAAVFDDYRAAQSAFADVVGKAQDRSGGGNATVATSALAHTASNVGTAISVVAIIAMLGLTPLFMVLLHGLSRRLGAVGDAIMRLGSREARGLMAAPIAQDELEHLEQAVVVVKSNAAVLQRQKSRLEQLNLWLDVALNNMTRGLSMFDAEQKLVVSNASYQRMYELPDELVTPGTTFAEIIEYRQRRVATLNGEQLDTSSRNPQELAARIAGLKTESHSTFVMKDGSIFEVSIKPLQQGGWVALHEDVTERRRDAEQIERLARRDTLTGLSNRLDFREKLDQATQSLAAGRPFALHCIDLDRFKEVNDTLGHPCGDELLKAVAMRLQACVRGGDVVARLGGDEFAVIQVGAASQKDATALGKRIIERMGAPYLIQGHRAEIGVTIGIALAPGDAQTPDELLKCGDMALYRAKAEGRGRLHFYDSAMEGEIRERRQLEISLEQAIDNGELELHYQPIVNLATREVSGCEALIRWRHPERGLVSPAQFIPLAEETGLIIPIGTWAIETACREAAGWPGDVKVAVNLSAAQFAGSDLVSIARAALEDSGLRADRLELEVTESLILETSAGNLKTLHALRDLGIRIALDDFGTGYSSLSYLRSFPFDKIKIDQTFVRDISQRQDCVAIVGAVAQLAASLSMATVAEGVETGDHLTKVQAAGCTEAQGYLFSRPVPSQHIVDVIARCNSDLGLVARVA